MTDETLYILEDNNVFVPANKWFEKRVVATVTDNNTTYILASLEERYKELGEKVNELVKELETTPEKVKLAGKVVRTKSYICNAKALGNYEVLLTLLDSIEDEIKKEVEKNIAEKERICTEAEALLSSTDLKAATETLRELQNQYKVLAAVPDLKNEELKDKFEKIKDDFFKKKQEKHADFENELLENLSKKLEICEQADALQHKTEWKKTTEKYAELTEQWKSIGMIPKHRSDELWMRFSNAKDVFFAKKKEHYEEVKGDQTEALVKKEEIILKAEALKESTDWKKTSEAMNELMEEWKKTGHVGADKSDKVWARFQEAKNYFYTKKDEHYSTIRIQLDDNFARKMSIVERAEELENTNDFETATQEYLDMMTEWKTIGRIAKEHGDTPWERFVKAKKNFFDRKDANRDKRREENQKEWDEKNAKQRSFYNKLTRELEDEENLILDFENQLKNLSINVRTYDKKEQLEKGIEDIKDRIKLLTIKINDVKSKMPQDRRHNNTRGNSFNQKKKEENIEAIIDEVVSEVEAKENTTTKISTKTEPTAKAYVKPEEKEVSMEDALAALKAKLGKK
jgi:hypothetical protein